MGLPPLAPPGHPTRAEALEISVTGSTSSMGIERAGSPAGRATQSQSALQVLLCRLRSGRLS